MRIAIFEIISPLTKKITERELRDIIEELRRIAPEPELLDGRNMSDEEKERQKGLSEAMSKDFCLVEKHPTKKDAFIINRSGTKHLAIVGKEKIKVSLGESGSDIAGKIAGLLMQKRIEYKVSYEEVK